MSISRIYQSLLAKQEISVKFPSSAEAKKFHAQLRVAKSRADKQFLAITGNETLSGEKVIVCKTLSETPTEMVVSFSLEKKQYSGVVQYEIISSQNNKGNEEVSRNLGKD